MTSKDSKLVAEWTWVKRFVDEVVQVAERCDIPLNDLANACLLTGEARRERLRALGDEGRKRQEDVFKQSCDERHLTVPLHRSGLVQNAVANLRRLTASGDSLAGSALTCILLLHPDFVRQDDRLNFQTFHSSNLGDARTLFFDEMNKKLEFARHVARALYMPSDKLTWSVARPSAGDFALLLLCEHSSAILAGSYRTSSHWHVVRVEEVRRTRCTATLLARVDLPGATGRIAVGQRLDYSLASVAACHSPGARLSKKYFTFSIPRSWHEPIADGGILGVLGPQPWPSRLGGWDACFTADDHQRLHLYLVDLAYVEGQGGWGEDDYFMSFALAEIDSGKGHVGRIDKERILVRCVWDDSLVR